MLEQRRAHHERMMTKTASQDVVDVFEKQGFGQKQRLKGVYSKPDSGYLESAESTGAGGHAQHLASACQKPWPIFKHVLPEVAFAGHSNSGKVRSPPPCRRCADRCPQSTLVNAMIGVPPRTGPAKVSDRAGWTDQICFYQLGRKPPALILADLPGYGHAVANAEAKTAWKHMIRDYLANRPVLTKCCILVDSTRGLCAQDFNYIRFLAKGKVDWSIILTKCDLLSCEELQMSRKVVAEDVAQFLTDGTSSNPSLLPMDNIPRTPALTPTSSQQQTSSMTLAKDLLKGERIYQVSASTGAGINALYRSLLSHAQQSAAPLSSHGHSVREHVKAAALRQEQGRQAIPRSAVKLSNRVRNKI